ncbi:Peptidyl-prolyl cis-trans isomerase CYP40 [Gossypium australe]|uniref:Peptidyl-prolyl cis-trans isomerase CYP40 n=1 Tax=Gossypium australe TaxID=47621 RepID=A0A5B6UV19_9ROSI|nr:Peptidyl-prolyl cis-trans isomerase CYP40 [Gossypium australe]
MSVATCEESVSLAARFVLVSTLFCALHPCLPSTVPTLHAFVPDSAITRSDFSLSSSSRRGLESNHESVAFSLALISSSFVFISSSTLASKVLLIPASESLGLSKSFSVRSPSPSNDCMAVISDQGIGNSLKLWHYKFWYG